MTDAARTDATLAPAAAPRATGAPSTHGGYLFGPLTDFIYLGGGSLIILGLIALFLPQGITEAQEFSLMMVLMLLINQPHFAHSYQMFYRNFGVKAFGPSYARSLRIRYVFAGIVVPLVLIAFLVFGVMNALQSKSTEILGYAFNAMFFFVGWHYVKQGYGILIVDSVQKRQFFSENTKRIFRANAYFCWLRASRAHSSCSPHSPNVGAQRGHCPGTALSPISHRFMSGWCSRAQTRSSTSSFRRSIRCNIWPWSGAISSMPPRKPRAGKLAPTWVSYC